MQIWMARIRLRTVAHIGLTACLQSAGLIERDGSKLWTEQGKRTRTISSLFNGEDSPI